MSKLTEGVCKRVGVSPCPTTSKQNIRPPAQKSKKVKTVFDEMEWLNNELMVMAAHRYCLGRQSYIVSACVDWLNAHWSKFSDKSHIVILRDTILALMDKLAGSETVDAPLWKEFCERHFNELTPINQENIVIMLSHRKDVPWPLSAGAELWPHNREKEK